MGGDEGRWTHLRDAEEIAVHSSRLSRVVGAVDGATSRLHRDTLPFRLRTKLFLYSGWTRAIGRTTRPVFVDVDDGFYRPALLILYLPRFLDHNGKGGGIKFNASDKPVLICASTSSSSPSPIVLGRRRQFRRLTVVETVAAVPWERRTDASLRRTHPTRTTTIRSDMGRSGGGGDRPLI